MEYFLGFLYLLVSVGMAVMFYMEGETDAATAITTAPLWPVAMLIVGSVLLWIVLDSMAEKIARKIG